ncbi:MAG TPA: A/G-specific adenine glycosylase [Candidatus Ozemobacteraceae bacterium]|nr:A/G-specific adenine glycosylase [Candidatus Ozemobacteraceae bacterium]
MAKPTKNEITSNLLAWYDAFGRDLPWRDTTDAYKILVSEIMLQQTQVPRVLLSYHRWLAQFPDWHILAEADTAAVIHAWAGLGYNRRALALRDIARQIVETGLPGSEEAWLKLKGVGPYTAAAMTVFSLGKHAVPIDTNIRRAGARLLLAVPYPEPRADERLKPALAAVLGRTRRFADIVQALFDLASLICLKKPLCKPCPLIRECRVSGGFLAGAYPMPVRPSPASRERRHRDKLYPDRIFRGRILRLVREAPDGCAVAGLGPSIDPTFDPVHDRSWLEAMIGRMIADGLIVRSGKRLKLPR